jgi:hypothetical protein
MNGKITITMPMEKVPAEVSRLLGTIALELEALVSLTKNIQQQNANHLFVINTIDDIRKRLSLVDFNYEDCYSILVGYLKYQTDKRLADMKSQEPNNDQQSNG